MNLDIKLHKIDLPDEIVFSDKIAIDCEFTGLNIERDRLCFNTTQIFSSNHENTTPKAGARLSLPFNLASLLEVLVYLGETPFCF